MGDINEKQKALLIALFPDKELSQNALGKAVGAYHETARRRAKPLIDQNLVAEEEVGEKGNFRRLYSLTDKGQEVGREVAKERITELEKESRRIREKLDEWERTRASSE